VAVLSNSVQVNSSNAHICYHNSLRQIKRSRRRAKNVTKSEKMVTTSDVNSRQQTHKTAGWVSPIVAYSLPLKKTVELMLRWLTQLWFESTTMVKVNMKKGYCLAVSDKLAVIDIKDRRFTFERRRFSYDNFIPERRHGKDRRDTIALFCHDVHSSTRITKEKSVDCQ
jgi:hypothetical protein